MGEWRLERFEADDRTELAVHRRGQGRTVVMLHGFLASSALNWIAPGIADRLIDAGFSVAAMDLRGHGRSDAPTDPRFWPTDVLASDGLQLLRYLDLDDFDLVGYSLGARTASRMLVRGAEPRRSILGGMGASGLMQAGARAAMFEDAIRHGERAKDPAAGRRVQAMIKQSNLNPDAMLGVLRSFAATSEDELRALTTPTLVIAGEDDDDNGSIEALSALLSQGQSARIPGNHLSAVGPPLGRAMVDFLRA